MRHLQIYLFFFICLTALSCNNKKSPDISKIKISIPIERFDQELNDVNPDSIAGKSSLSQKKIYLVLR
jgi:hypothetical protein